MGTGASKGTVGVPLNPRVQYSQGLEKKEQKRVLVDAPVLVDVEHGSVRYRHPDTPSKGKEMPYENEKAEMLSNKEHYFYHARLREYGPDISKEKEDKFKLFYVLKGPNSAMQKKLFYVYGQGWGARDGSRLKPTETLGQGRDYAWSSTRSPNSLYYGLDFDSEDQGCGETSKEDQILSDLEPTPDKSKIRMCVAPDERIRDLKARLAIRLLKSANDIHIAFDGKELRDVDVVKEFQLGREDQVTEAQETQEDVVQGCAIVLTLIV